MEKKTTIILAVLVALVACGVAISLFASPSSMSSSGNQTITDMANRTVNIPSDVNRVVATSPPMTTIMYMLAPEKLVGVNFQWTDEELKYVPDQYKDKFPVIGGWFGSQDGNYEQFLAAEPNFVVESIDEGMGVDLSTVEERQEKFGTIPVVAVTEGGNDFVTSASNTAYLGIRGKSLIIYLCFVCSSVITVATVVSVPVPAVVGTAISSGIFFNILKIPTIFFKL